MACVLNRSCRRSILRYYNCWSRKLSSDRKAVPPSSSLVSRVAAAPWLMLPPTFGDNDNLVYNFYSIGDRKAVNFSNRGGKEEVEMMQGQKTRAVGSSHGWLAIYNELRPEFFLSNPVSGRRVELPLPPLPPPEHATTWTRNPEKVIIAGSPEQALMSYGPRNRLAFCRPGRSEEWTCTGLPERSYRDFVYSNAEKRFLCLSEAHDNKHWHLESREIGDIEAGFSKPVYGICTNKVNVERLRRKFSGMTRYLVLAEQSNQLYLITRYMCHKVARDGTPFEITFDKHKPHLIHKPPIYPYKTIDFCVRKIIMGPDYCYLKESLNGLDGLAVFIGINHSFVMSPAEFPHLIPNSIYFTDDNFTMPGDFFCGYDNGIYDTVNGTWSPCNFQRIEPKPLWYTPTPP